MPNDPQRRSNFQYPKTDDEVGRSQWAGVHRAHGTGDVDAVFGGAPKTLTPWPQAGRTKADPRGYDPARVEAAVRDPHPHMREIDPRNLHSTQPWITREGVSHYMGDEYKKTGQTFRDMDQAGNRFPVVYNRGGQNKLLSGHHRATAALIRGEQFRGIYIEE